MIDFTSIGEDFMLAKTIKKWAETWLDPQFDCVDFKPLVEESPTQPYSFQLIPLMCPVCQGMGTVLLVCNNCGGLGIVWG